MKAIFTVFVIFMVSCFSAQAQNAAKTFAWLKGGEWQMNTQKGFIIERWKDTANGDLTGEAYFSDSNGIRTPLEQVLLTCDDNNCWYIPVTATQNDREPVRFRVKTKSAQSFVAENPDHDFPKRITYELVSYDSIHAWIDDGKPVPLKRSDYYYKRKKQ